MKKLRRILIAVAVIALVACAVAVSTSAAVNFTGQLSVLDNHFTTLEAMEGAAEKLSYMDKNLRVYLMNRPTDPSSNKDEFKATMERYDSMTASVVEGYIEIVDEQLALADEERDATKKQQKIDKARQELEKLCTYLNKMKAVKFYYDGGAGATPIENKYGECYFYYNDSEVAQSARKALNNTILSFAEERLIPVLENVSDSNDAAAGNYISDYLSFKNADESAKPEFLQKLRSASANMIAANESLRTKSLILHNFLLRDCPIDKDETLGEGGIKVYPPSHKRRFNDMIETFSLVEYSELKSDVAAYFAYEYSESDAGKHINLNSAADRISVINRKYGVSMSKEAEDYETVMALVSEVAVNINQRNEQKKLELEYNTPLSEYNLKSGGVDLNMNDGKYGYSLMNGEGTPAGMGTGSTLAVVTDEYNRSNKYVEFTLGKAKGEDGISATTDSFNAYVDMKLGNTSSGYVMEFDVMTKSDAFSGLKLHTAEDASDGSGRCYINFFSTSNGVINANGNGTFNGGFVPGEWTHITFCYVPDNGQGKPAVTLYVDYEWIGYWWSAAEGSGRPYKLSVLRITPNANHYNLCMDNFHFYAGTGYRNVNKFENLTDVQLYKTYTDIYTNDKYSPSNRDYALNQAELLHDSVKNNAEIRNGKINAEVYNAEDGTYIPSELTYAQALNEYLVNRQAHILDKAVAETMEKLRASIGDTFTQKVTSSNVNLISKKVNEISVFMSANSAYIPAEDPDVIQYKRDIGKYKKDITRITNTLELLTSLELFDRATTCASMIKRMEEVNRWYKICEFNDVSNYNLVKDDSAVQSYLTSVGKTDLLEHIASMQSRIDAQRLKENSKKIINCIDIITSIKGYEPTEDFLFENEEFIEQYISAIRAVLKDSSYDATYEGVDEAISVYDSIYPYFYSSMQYEHANIIREKLFIYTTTDSFITKLGVCTFIENYLAENDVDYTHKSIAPLVELYGVYAQEIKSQTDSYNEATSQNTDIFITLVARMQTTTSYKALRELCDEASLTLCAMNVSSPEAQAAIVIYDEYVAMLEAKENSCELFVQESLKLKFVKTKKDTYTVLVACSQYIEDADAEVKGVAAALKLYNEKLLAYNESINKTNSLIMETGNVAMSVRTVSVHSAILEVIKSWFSK